MLLLAWFFAQEAPVLPGSWEQVGIIGASWLAIGWLIKDRARVVAQRDALFRELTDTTGATTAVLEHVGPILEAVRQELQRREPT